MKYKKIISAIVELSLCMVITTGCFPSVETNNIKNNVTNNLTSNATNQSEINSAENVENKTIEFPEHINDNDIDKLKIDADVILPDNFDIGQQIATAAAEYKIWDREKIVSGISKGREVIDEVTEENMGPDDLFYRYDFDDNSNITFYSNGVYYDTEMSIECQYSSYFDNFRSYIYENSLTEEFGEEDINGLSKSDALNSTDELVTLLNIKDVLGEPKIYSMDADTINKIIEKDDARDKYGERMKDWGSEQEAYLIDYPVVYDNIPSLRVFANGENEIITGSKAYFIYGRNGFAMFEVLGIFDVKNIEQESGVYSPLNSVENVKNFFKDIIMDSPLNISIVKLVYIMRYDIIENPDKLKIEPVWFIYGQYEDSPQYNHDKKSDSGGEYVTLINAVTGETVPVLSIGG